MKVITLNGEIINVGDWDYQVKIDEDGTEVIHNPMPAGAIEEDIETVQDANGRLRRADDYYCLRQAEYPSVGDQLDAIFKAGLFPPEMGLRIQAVKDRYPKP